MDSKIFKSKKLDEYSKQAQELWGKTDAYKEFEKKNVDRSSHDHQVLAGELMSIFKDLGALKETDPTVSEVQALIKKLQDFISEHYYTCTNEILQGLGEMYAAGGEFTDNIDKVGGAGTGAFSNVAIQHYCNR